MSDTARAIQENTVLRYKVKRLQHTIDEQSAIIRGLQRQILNMDCGHYTQDELEILDEDTNQ